MITLLVTAAEFAAAQVEVRGGAYRHLFRARRAAADETLRLVDGAGGARWARIARIDGAAALVIPGEPCPPRDPSPGVEIWVASPRPERAAWLAEKCGELGVERLCLFVAERGVRRSADAGRERLQRLADAALQQSHGARRCLVSGPHPFDELLAPASPGEGVGPVKLLLDGSGRGLLDPSLGLLPPVARPPRARLAVGPEGGFSGEERASLEAAGWVPVSLGARTLRIETAAVLAAGLLLSPSR